MYISMYINITIVVSIYVQNYEYTEKTLPTTVTGNRFGIRPNEYWKNPLPEKTTGASPMRLRI